MKKSRGHPIRSGVWTASRLLVLALALVATFGIFFLTAFRVTTVAREVAVPDVRGLAVADAGRLLTDSGLAIRVDDLRRPSTEVPANHVVSQDPEPGTVLRRQRSVRVRLSDGEEGREVPDVAGTAERVAEATLAEASVTVVSRAEIRTSDYPTGTVVSTDPPTGEASSGVNLLVNRGERSSTYVMPDLIGTNGRQAVGVLRARGFRATIVAEVIYPGLPSGIVIRQTPQAGFQIAFGETISLEVSR
ncbi:MAG TPA: PASTA domain-containing protein [Vicinamibacterales bacterium]|nr:PASTA domain-containing protein [Vicinamibacterales bacterium]